MMQHTGVVPLETQLWWDWVYRTGCSLCETEQSLHCRKGSSLSVVDVLVHTVAPELLTNELLDWACQHENIPSFLFRFVKVARRHFPMSLCSHAANQKATATWWPRKLVKMSLCCDTVLTSPSTHCQFETHSNFKTVESFTTEHCCPLTRQKQAWMTFFSWFHVCHIQPSHKQGIFSASCCCRFQVHPFLTWLVCTRTNPPDNLQTASLFISVPNPLYGAVTCW